MKILIISDLHYPYAHPDHISFLKEVKSKFRFNQKDKYIMMGDEIDNHSISFHDHDPDLPNPTKELELAIQNIKKLEKVFPKLDLLNSNHGSLLFRRRKFHRLPDYILKDYADKFGRYYFTHNMNADCLKSAQALNYEGYIQSHYHSKFELKYFSSPEALRWGMTVGCLIDKDSLAFAYSKVNIKRPVIGCAVIIDGVPQLIPMTLKRGGKWVGKL